MGRFGRKRTQTDAKKRKRWAAKVLDAANRCNDTQTDANVRRELQNLYSAVDAHSTPPHHSRLLRNKSARRLWRKPRNGGAFLLLGLTLRLGEVR